MPVALQMGNKSNGVNIGADDEAGPNYTKQPVVNSFYERR